MNSVYMVVKSKYEQTHELRPSRYNLIDNGQFGSIYQNFRCCPIEQQCHFGQQTDFSLSINLQMLGQNQRNIDIE